MSKVITTTLEHICVSEKGAIISGPFGSNISSKYFVDEGIPVIRGNNLSLSLDKFYDNGFVFVTKQKAEELNCYAKKLDLIFTAAGTLGQVGLIPETAKYEEYVISNKQIRVRIDTDKVDILYAYYWFASPWIQRLLALSNKGSTVPLLTLWEVKNLPISYPENIEEQHRIALVLETIGKKIEKNDQISFELESMAKAIYDYWFLQFEFPNEERKPYKSSGGKMVWNEELKREIPESWESVQLKDIFFFIKGKTPEKLADEQGNNSSPYITIEVANDMNAQFCSKNNMPYCNGEVIMVMDGAASGDVYIGNYGVLGSTFAMMKRKRQDISDALIYRILNWQSPVYKKANTGSTVPHANRKFIESIKIPIAKDMTAYSNVFNEIYKKIIQNRKENKELILLRDFLLPLLMNGQVKFLD